MHTADYQHKKMDIKDKILRFFVNVLVTKRRYVLLVFVEIVLFLLHFYIVSPSNFESFSTTLRNFISALGTLLAVVVSFNTLSLQNQLKNMPTNIKNLDKQVQKISDLLQPIIDLQNNHDSDKILNKYSISKEIRDNQTKNPQLFKDATIYFNAALESVFVIVMYQVRNILSTTVFSDDEKDEPVSKREFIQICKSMEKRITTKLNLYQENERNPYYLISIPSTNFIQELKFISFTFVNEKTKALFENVKKLHILRNIGVRIYLRNMLANLSYEMLILTIPVIAYVALIAAISNYEDYNTFMLRTLFAISISMATMPFVLLLVRTIPILHIIKGSSSIPFASER